MGINSVIRSLAVLAIALTLAGQALGAPKQAVTVNTSTKVLVTPSASNFRTANSIQESGTILEGLRTNTASSTVTINNVNLQLRGVEAGGAVLAVGSSTFSGDLFNINGANYGSGFFEYSDSSRSLSIGDFAAANNSTVITIDDGTGGGTIFLQAANVEVSHDNGIKTQKLIGRGGTPGISAGTGAGTGGSSLSISLTGTDVAGRISLTTRGTGLASSSPLFTVTFDSAYPGSGPRAVILTPGNVNAKALSGTSQVFVDSGDIDQTGFTVTTGSALSATTTYVWYYVVVGQE